MEKAYFGLGRLFSLLLAIIPVTNIILGIITRAKRGNALGAVLNVFLCFIFYFIDLVTIIFAKDITVMT